MKCGLFETKKKWGFYLNTLGEAESKDIIVFNVVQVSIYASSPRIILGFAKKHWL